LSTLFISKKKASKQGISFEDNCTHSFNDFQREKERNSKTQIKRKKEERKRERERERRNKQ
jgi:hypothetical protein